MGTTAASAGAAGPSGDYGPDGAADRLCRSTQQHADDTTTRQSDARDSESVYLPTSDKALALNYSVSLFIQRSPHKSVGTKGFEKDTLEGQLVQAL